MLTWRLGDGWSFRRTVPEPLRALVGRREIWVALGTTSRRAAFGRAAHLQGCVEEVFSAARLVREHDMDHPPSELQSLSAEGRAEHERIMASSDLGRVVEEIGRIERENEGLAGENADILRHLAATATKLDRLRVAMQRLEGVTDAIAAARATAATVKDLEGSAHQLLGPLAEAREQRGHASGLMAALVEAVGAARQPQPPLQPAQRRSPEPAKAGSRFSECLPDFLAHKGKEWTAQTMHQARATFRLWTELMGDTAVGSVTGRDADDFIALLRTLPASHGKGNPGLDAARAIQRADASPTQVPRLSEKTVKRHVSALSQFWIWMLPLDHVTRNVFEGHRFATSKSSKKAKRDDWADADLLKVMATRWTNGKVSAEAYRWLILVAMFTGMRLEEIARLRPQHDFRVVDGVPMLIVQDHPDGWTPKTEAGGRAIPIHPALVKLGFLDLVAARRASGAERIIPGLLSNGPDAKLGTEFSREFSRHKIKADIGRKTVFHSFRQSVSTMLRNTDASIRSEWIDAVLGHEAGQKSEGATTYLKRIGASNLQLTISALR